MRREESSNEFLLLQVRWLSLQCLFLSLSPSTFCRCWPSTVFSSSASRLWRTARTGSRSRRRQRPSQSRSKCNWTGAGWVSFPLFFSTSCRFQCFDIGTHLSLLTGCYCVLSVRLIVSDFVLFRLVSRLKYLASFLCLSLYMHLYVTAVFCKYSWVNEYVMCVCVLLLKYLKVCFIFKICGIDCSIWIIRLATS